MDDPKTKNGTEHRVPLSDAAMAVLETMRPLRDSSDVVFSGHDKILLRTLDRMGPQQLDHARLPRNLQGRGRLSAPPRPRCCRGVPDPYDQATGWSGPIAAATFWKSEPA